MADNNKILKFELSPESIKIKKILRKDFLEVELRAISTAYPNRNNSYFTKESLIKAIPTVYNKPLLGSFSTDNDDFRQHNSELKWDNELGDLFYDYTDPTSETPIGLIRSEDKVVVRDDEETGLSWLCFSASIWVKYNYKQVKSLLKSKDGKKKVSVEIEVVDSYEDEKGIEVINEFIFDGVTILGQSVTEGIAGAEMSILDMVSSSLFQKKQKCLCYAYDSLKNNENNNQNFSSSTVDNEKPVINENTEEITMVQEGGNKNMLTCEAKKALLEAFVLSNIKQNENDYGWVCDIDDNFVYFYYNDQYYSAPYIITEDENGKGIATVDLEAKQVVVRSWTVFVEDTKESLENKTTESFAQSSECFEGNGKWKENDEDDEPDDDNGEDDDKCEGGDCEEKEDMSCKETNACDKMTNACVNKETAACDKWTEACTKMVEACGKSDMACDNKECEACDKKDTEACTKSSMACGDKETEACGDKMTEACGDKETEACSDKSSMACDPENKECEACGDKETEACDPENKECEACGDKSTQSCTDANNCFSAQDNAQTEKQREFVMLDNEQVSINQLLEKYNSLNQNYSELNDKYQALYAQEEERNINSMISFGCDLVKNEARLSDSDRETFSKEIEEKCKNKEFSDNDSLKKFVITQIAVALYNADTEAKNNSEKKADFCVDIVKPVENHTMSDIEKLKEANKKLNRI